LKTSLEVLNLNSNDIETLNLMDSINITNLNLFNNKIQALPENFFRNFTRLKSIDLENNLIQDLGFLRSCIGRNIKFYLKNNMIFRISHDDDLLIISLIQSIGSIDSCLLNERTRANYQIENSNSRINEVNIGCLKGYYVPGRIYFN
jgi:hypothetical protein